MFVEQTLFMNIGDSYRCQYWYMSEGSNLYQYWFASEYSPRYWNICLEILTDTDMVNFYQYHWHSYTHTCSVSVNDTDIILLQIHGKVCLTNNDTCLNILTNTDTDTGLRILIIRKFTDNYTVYWYRGKCIGSTLV